MAVAASKRRCSNIDVQSVGGVGVRFLIAAVADGDEEVVARILETGADPWMSVTNSEFDHTPCPTPLHQACFDGRLDLVQLMVTSRESRTGSDLDSVNYQGQTPLMLAVQSGSVELVSFLIGLGCSVNISDADANNPMHMVAAASVRRRCQGHGAWSSSEQHRMVDLLSSHSVNIRQRNRYGFTPLRLAALMGNYECVHSMLKRTVTGTGEQTRIAFGQSQPETDVIASCRALDEHRNVVAMSGTSDRRHQLTKSLHSLVYFRSPDTSPPTLKRMSSLNGNPHTGSPQESSNVDGPSSLLGVTPLYAACVTGDIDAARLLLDVRLADPDREGVFVGSSLRRTARHLVSLPLGMAVLRNDVELARLLLSRGASACRQCLDGPPEVGCRRRHRDQEDDHCDLLELALYTDWPISRLLVASGACVTPTVERFVEAALRSADQELNSVEPSVTSLVVNQVTELALAIYEATGNRESACRMLSSTASGRSTGVSRSDGGSMLQLTRLVIRRSLGPRVLWGARRLPVPSILQQFIAFDEIPREAIDTPTMLRCSKTSV